MFIHLNFQKFILCRNPGSTKCVRGFSFNFALQKLGNYHSQSYNKKTKQNKKNTEQTEDQHLVLKTEVTEQIIPLKSREKNRIQSHS